MTVPKPLANASTPVRTIAFVSDAIYPYNKGGKETRLHEITTRLAAKGYDVHIYCMKWWSGDNERMENGVKLHGICPFIPLYDGPRRSIKQGVLFGLACFKLITAKFDAVDVDHMPYFPLYSMRIVCWLKGKPMFATWHEVWGKEYWNEYLGGVKGLIAWLIEAISVKFPDKIFAVSEMTANRLKKDLNYAGPVVVIHNGIDIDTINNAKVSSNTSDVIYAGRLLKHKNIDILIEAVSLAKQKNPGIRTLIAGEGPEKVNLTKLVKKLNLQSNVRFLPFQEKVTELYGLIKASKVFVLPSSREGFGLVVLEANACGIPVITVDEPDNAAVNLIDGKNGLVTQLSARKIADAILRNYHSTKKNYKLNKYDWNLISQKVISNYYEIANTTNKF